MAPASMMKVPLAAAVTKLWLDGIVHAEDRVTVSAANLTVNDAASPLAEGYSARLDELLHLMIARSDNVATNVLIDVVGRSRATAFAQSWGLKATAIRRKVSGSLPLIADPQATGRNAHSAGDAAALFALIAQNRIAGSDRLFAALAAQEWNEKLSPGLRKGDRFAHKTGDTDEVSHDGGILDAGDSRFVLVVYTALPSSDEANARFARFMRLLRPHLD